jgi:hypothetical protein
MAKPSLLLEPRGKEFVLTRVDDRGSRTAMVLSEEDIMVLGQSAQRFRDVVLARQSRAGAIAVVLTPVAKVALDLDVHKTEIHMAMIDPNGTALWFLLPSDIARQLVERLPVRLAEIEAARPTKQ